MAATTTATPQTPEPIGAAGRIIGALIDPRKTFEDIARKPSWLAPLLVLVICNVAITVLIGQRIGWRNVIERQDEQNASLQQRMQQMTPEQREQMLNTQAKLAPPIGYAVGVLGFPVIALIVAGVFLGAFNGVLGAELNYKTSFSIVAHSYMPFVIALLLGILILFLKPAEKVDIQNLVAANVGAFLSSDAPKWLQSLGTSLDAFTFWVLGLMAFGFAVARPKKITMASGLTWIVGIWLLFTAIKIGIIAMIS
jgi:Yip1 domain